MGEVVIVFFFWLVASFLIRWTIVITSWWVFKFTIPKLFNLVNLFLAELNPCKHFLSLNSNFDAGVFIIFLIAWFVIHSLFSQVTKSKGNLSNLTHVDAVCRVARWEVKFSLSFQFNLDESFKGCNIFSIKRLSQNMENLNCLLTCDVTELEVFDNVKHSVNNFSFQQAADHLFAVLNFSKGWEKHFKKFNRSNSVNTDFLCRLLSLIDVSVISDRILFQKKNAIVGQVSEKPCKLFLNLSFSFLWNFFFRVIEFFYNIVKQV